MCSRCDPPSINGISWIRYQEQVYEGVLKSDPSFPMSLGGFYAHIKNNWKGGVTVDATVVDILVLAATSTITV